MHFILCPSCSNNIGEIMQFVIVARRGLIKKSADASDAHISMLNLQDNSTPSIGHILDAVGLTQERMCCRMHVMGASAGK